MPVSVAAARKAASCAGFGADARQARGLVTKTCAASPPIWRAVRKAWAGREPVGIWRPKRMGSSFAVETPAETSRSLWDSAAWRGSAGSVGGGWGCVVTAVHVVHTIHTIHAIHTDGRTDALGGFGATLFAGRGLRQIGPGQRFDAGEAELLEELRCGAEEGGPTDGGRAANLHRQTELDETGEGTVAVDAANEFELRAGDGLAIGDDGERFERGGGELGLGRHAEQRGDVARVFGRGDELRGVVYLLQTDATPAALALLREATQRLTQTLLVHEQETAQ